MWLQGTFEHLDIYEELPMLLCIVRSARYCLHLLLDQSLAVRNLVHSVPTENHENLDDHGRECILGNSAQGENAFITRGSYRTSGVGSILAQHLCDIVIVKLNCVMQGCLEI